MKLFVVLIFVGLNSVLSADEEYQYDTDVSSIKKSDGGQRLVGAARAKHDDIKFVVPWSIITMEGNNVASCTGSLITPLWMVSAAHCDTLVKKNKEDACIKASRNGGNFRAGMGSVTCSRDSMGGLRITPVKPHGKAWVGASEVIPGPMEDAFEVIIKQTVHHVDSYEPGGSYGTFGGYDITLVEFEKPVPAQFGVPACLPTPSFKDHGVDALLAGYGKYTRPACQTDEYSPYKYHYCEEMSNDASTNGEKICDQGPAPVSAFCKNFFAKADIKQVPEGFDEVGIVTDNGLEFCYNLKSPNPSSKGWCKTNKDYYSINPRNADKDAWGFCSKDCYLSDSEPTGNVLRQADARVLEEDICEEYLKVAAPNVKVKPQVICVGKNNDWRTKYYKQDGNAFTALSEEESKNHRHFGQRLDKFGVTNGYITSAGTCNGDSGGPVYVLEDGTPIVIGSVSGGRGRMGKCGGINNPVHYVRLSRMALWMVKVLGTEEASKLCWHKEFSEKLKNHKKNL